MNSPTTKLDDVREQVRRTWNDDARGWIGAPSDIVGALSRTIPSRTGADLETGRRMRGRLKLRSSQVSWAGCPRSSRRTITHSSLRYDARIGARERRLPECVAKGRSRPAQPERPSAVPGQLPRRVEQALCYLRADASRAGPPNDCPPFHRDT